MYHSFQCTIGSTLEVNAVGIQGEKRWAQAPKSALFAWSLRGLPNSPFALLITSYCGFSVLCKKCSVSSTHFTIRIQRNNQNLLPRYAQAVHNAAKASAKASNIRHVLKEPIYRDVREIKERDKKCVPSATDKPGRGF
ncbi:hypothetical protein ACJJTC_013786 [Scirpophaga incertulas]